MARSTSCSSLLLASVGVVALVSGCHGPAATSQATPELNVAPMPSGTVAPQAASSNVVASTETTGTPPSTDTDTETPEAARPPGDTCGLIATIHSAAGKHFSVTLTNKGTKAVRLVVPGDGSEAGMRTPVLTWMATAGGKPGEPAPAGRCGLTNPMDAKEVFTLAPGASREMKEWLGEPRVKPGTYDVKLRFRNDPTAVRNASPEVTKLVAATDACDVTSNAIKVTISAP